MFDIKMLVNFSVIVKIYFSAIIIARLTVVRVSAQDGDGNRREGLNANLVWWTPFTGWFNERKNCGEVECYVTEDKGILNIAEVDAAILFYGSDIKPENLPISRYSQQIWALLHEESPKNNAILCHPNMLKLFNYTSTFSRYSSEPITLQYLKSLEEISSPENFVPIRRKNELVEEGLAPIIYIQSDCDTPSDRDSFVQLLQKHVQVDSYGRCLNNRALPEELRGGVASMDHPALLQLVAKYKFAVAIENTACDDYITEKLWRPLSVGTVPLYWGSPSITDWLPNNNSVVNIRHYNSPHHLAQHIKLLLQNDTLYAAYLGHKLDGKVTNKLLKRTMEDRVWGVGNDPDRINFIEHFECSVCRALHTRRTEQMMARVDGRHYNCAAPTTVLQSMNKRNSSKRKNETHAESRSSEYSPWLEEWHRTKLEAKKLSKLLLSGKYSTETYHQDILDYLIKKGHFRKFPPLLHEEL